MVLRGPDIIHHSSGDPWYTRSSWSGDLECPRVDLVIARSQYIQRKRIDKINSDACLNVIRPLPCAIVDGGT